MADRICRGMQTIYSLSTHNRPSVVIHDEQVISILCVRIMTNLQMHRTTIILTATTRFPSPPNPSLPLQAPVTIANGVDSSPTEYIFSYNGFPIPVSTSTLMCTSSSCQHTFRVTSSQVQQYTVSVAARNVVGVGNASTPMIIGMHVGIARSSKYHIMFNKIVPTHQAP